MLCPTDQTVLVMSDRQGVEIDYCPTCRGVWLDRGELDKIIDRSSAAAPQPAPAQASRPDYGTRDAGYHDERRDGRRDDRSIDPRTGQPRKRKKESWLGELFDL